MTKLTLTRTGRFSWSGSLRWYTDDGEPLPCPERFGGMSRRSVVRQAKRYVRREGRRSAYLSESYEVVEL